MGTAERPRLLRPRTIAEKLLRVPWFVLMLVGLIGSIGVAALYSVAGGSYEPWAERHALRLALGLAAILALALVPPRFWTTCAYPVYGAALLMLLGVALVGIVQMGARRWLGVPGLSFQPSEVMKIALILGLARYYQWLPAEKVSRPLWVALPFAMIMIPTALVLRQPDLGTAILIAATGLALMFFAGVNLAYFIAGASTIAVALPAIWLHLHDYQKKRVATFLDPDSDPLGASYHITQSKIALGSGGLNGKGFMAGTQSQLNFLPEKHTDFIFTMFAEEMGFTGSAALLLLYALLIGLLLRIGFSVRNQFSRLLAGGAAVLFALHAVVNIAMVTGLLPVVGVPLPLVSYGGTSLTTLVVAIGLAVSVHVHRGERLRREDLGPI